MIDESEADLFQGRYTFLMLASLPATIAMPLLGLIAGREPLWFCALAILVKLPAARPAQTEAKQE